MTRILHPLRAWHRASLRTQIRLAGQATFATGLLIGRAVPSAWPLALVVFAAGALITAATIRGADHDHR